MRTPKAQMRIALEGDEPVLLVEIKQRGRFVPIAKRYSQQNWVALEPGYVVRGSEPGSDYNTIEIEYNPANAELQ